MGILISVFRALTLVTEERCGTWEKSQSGDKFPSFLNIDCWYQPIYQWFSLSQQITATKKNNKFVIAQMPQFLQLFKTVNNFEQTACPNIYTFNLFSVQDLGKC